VQATVDEEWETVPVKSVRSRQHAADAEAAEEAARAAAEREAQAAGEEEAQRREAAAAASAAAAAAAAGAARRALEGPRPPARRAGGGRGRGRGRGGPGGPLYLGGRGGARADAVAQYGQDGAPVDSSSYGSHGSTPDMASSGELAFPDGAGGPGAAALPKRARPSRSGARRGGGGARGGAMVCIAEEHRGLERGGHPGPDGARGHSRAAFGAGPAPGRAPEPAIQFGSFEAPPATSMGGSLPRDASAPIAIAGAYAGGPPARARELSPGHCRRRGGGRGGSRPGGGFRGRGRGGADGRHPQGFPQGGQGLDQGQGGAAWNPHAGGDMLPQAGWPGHGRGGGARGGRGGGRRTRAGGEPFHGGHEGVRHGHQRMPIASPAAVHAEA